MRKENSTRNNIAFTPENHKYIRILARSYGKTANDVVNMIVERSRKENADIMKVERMIEDTLRGMKEDTAAEAEKKVTEEAGKRIELRARSRERGLEPVTTEKNAEEGLHRLLDVLFYDEDLQEELNKKVGFDVAGVIDKAIDSIRKDIPAPLLYATKNSAGNYHGYCRHCEAVMWIDPRDGFSNNRCVWCGQLAALPDKPVGSFEEDFYGEA